MSYGSWSLDGYGLSAETLEMIAEHDDVRVHLRLRSPDGGACGACDGGLGQLWSGVPSEVNCPACLEVVHA